MDELAGPRAFAAVLAAASDSTLSWEHFRAGIEVRWLYKNVSGPSAALLRYAPGATLPRHTHPGYEHILILSGSQSDDLGTHPAGTLLVHPPGTSHSIASENGCVALAMWEKPVVFLASGDAAGK
jgi:anti-sigma factor ChrR (cupin superfamily)